MSSAFGHRAANAEELLLAYLRDRDVLCPQCRYNLRDLTRPVCPECSLPVMLSVGARPLTIGMLLSMLAPGYFCGVGIVLFLVIMLISGVIEKIFSQPVGCMFIAFCVSSGVASLVLSHRRARHWFLALERTRQRAMVVAMWGVHICALAALFNL